MAVSVPVTFDSFLHNQQLRKKLLRSFCNQGPKVSRLHYFSRLRVNEHHELVYCTVPDVGTEHWDRILKILNDVPGQAEKVVNESAPLKAPHEYLSRYNMSTIDSLLASYTKIIFIRDPLQRLLATYRRKGAMGEPFEAFVQRVLGQDLKLAASWRPLVDLCHPCLVRYDYVAAHGLLDGELRHLLRRLGLSAEVELPEFLDWEESLSSRGLVQQHFAQLSTQLAGRVLQFYRSDFAAFNFTIGLTLD
uniref:carbohydrate sulfotransferase 9-like n=1 Tax=Pristiophorus japonicus TaxID=55135 RepID=UPI00398F1966